MGFFGDLERFLAELYAYRWPIAVAALVVLAAVATLAYRKSWHTAIWRHRLTSAFIVTPAVALTIVGGWYALSPLVLRTQTEEASPLALAATFSGKGMTAGPSAAVREAVSGAVDEKTNAENPTRMENTSEKKAMREGSSEFTPGLAYQGEFRGTDDFHFGLGRALLIETEQGQYALRFEDFSVRNGPGLYVYLSPDPEGYTTDSLELGKLKATDGSFNYEVPAGTDVTQFKSAVIWCKPFGVLFAVAPLIEQ